MSRKIGAIHPAPGGFKFWSNHHRCISFQRTYEDCLREAVNKGWQLAATDEEESNDEKA